MAPWLATGLSTGAYPQDRGAWWLATRPSVKFSISVKASKLSNSILLEGLR